MLHPRSELQIFAALDGLCKVVRHPINRSALDLDTLSDWGSLRLLLYICLASDLLG